MAASKAGLLPAFEYSPKHAKSNQFEMPNARFLLSVQDRTWSEGSPRRSSSTPSSRGPLKDGMGFRYSPVPYDMGSPFREQQGHSLAEPAEPAEPAEQKLLSVLPAQYALSTLPSDRDQHAQLLHNLRLEQQREGREAQNVHLSWAPNDSSSFSLWLVFNDRRGSLGVITSVLAEFGIDISKVAAFSTPDGIAVTSFTVSRMDEELAAKLRVRLAAAFCGPFSNLRVVRVIDEGASSKVRVCPPMLTGCP